MGAFTPEQVKNTTSNSSVRWIRQFSYSPIFLHKTINALELQRTATFSWDVYIYTPRTMDLESEVYVELGLLFVHHTWLHSYLHTTLQKIRIFTLNLKDFHNYDK